MGFDLPHSCSSTVVTMLIKALVVAGAFAAGGLVVQSTWQQTSWPGVPFQLGSAVAVVPSANDIWCWSASEPALVQVGPIPIAGVNPISQNKWATITDIAFRTTDVTSPRRWWWIRDGNTGQVLYGEPIRHPDTWNSGAVTGGLGVVCHLTTPIVLSYTGANPPTFELGPFLGAPYLGADWMYDISVIGRYVYNT